MIPLDPDPYGPDLFDTARRIGNNKDADWINERLFTEEAPFDK